ncbi:MAG: hypothetical protein M3P85_13385 [Actinomycetota bacterium]|nr:hypothetical protein [Actinomycetota bacterium]
MLKTFRRAMLALSVASAAAAVLRSRRSSGTSSQGGRWRELSGPDLR